jgi:hypothetical protein
MPPPMQEAADLPIENEVEAVKNRHERLYC